MRKIYILLCYMAIALASCDKDTEPFNFAPELTVNEAADINRFSATLSGSIHQPKGCKVEECGIQYSIYPDIQQGQKLNIDTSIEGGFTVNLTGLKAGQEYFYCTYASSGYSMVKSEIKSFTTLSTSGPVFGVCVKEGITATSVEVSTTLVDDGGVKLSEFGYVYKQVTNETDRDFKIGDHSVEYVKSEDKEYKMTISDLEPGRMYGIRPYGKSDGEGYGDAMFVTTETTSTPALSSCTLSDTTQTTVRVSARILSEGTSAVTEQGFFYSMENPNPEEGSRSKKAENTAGSITAVLDELIPQQTYYIRAYAKNSIGYGYGEVTKYYVTQMYVPVVTTSPVTEITETSVKVAGTITSDGNAPITSKGFCWSATNAQPTVADSKHEVNGEGSSFATVITGLKSGQKYYVRFYAGNIGGITYGNVIEFTTSKTNIPVLAATTVMDITKTSVHALSSVTSDGGAAIIEKGFCISSASNTPTTSDRKVIVESTTDAFSAAIDKLKEGTKYNVRAYAINKNGTSYGEVVTFTTIAIPLPKVSTSSVTEITETSAKVTGIIVSDEDESIISKGFCWSTTNTQPTVNDCKHEINDEGITFTTILTGLMTEQKYYVRFYAENRAGIAYGNVLEFTTLLALPIVYTYGVMELTETSANVLGSIALDENGNLVPVKLQGFCWSTTNTLPTINDSYQEVTGNGLDFALTLTGLISGQKYYLRFYAENNSGIAYGNVIEFVVQSATGSINGYKWADLGLPSGLKWATCNVGAFTPGGYGYYFAWGETTTKSSYDEENSSAYGKDNSWLYSNGYIDSSGHLSMSHDAARKNWGSSWRMPTGEEIDELIANTTTKWITYKGVRGCLVTSRKNGNSIFLPAAGSRDGTSFESRSLECSYWSSSLSEDESSHAYTLYFYSDDSDYLDGVWSDRYFGQSIRPVSE